MPTPAPAKGALFLELLHTPAGSQEASANISTGFRGPVVAKEDKELSTTPRQVISVGNRQVGMVGCLSENPQVAGLLGKTQVNLQIGV